MVSAAIFPVLPLLCWDQQKILPKTLDWAFGLVKKVTSQYPNHISILYISFNGFQCLINKADVLSLHNMDRNQTRFIFNAFPTGYVYTWLTADLTVL